MKCFDKTTLAAGHGQAGAPVLVACQGKVYDLAASFLWRQGRHQVLHQAGTDLTSALAEAPHGADLLERYPQVGIYQE